jgi:hypothetical protein
VVRAADGAAVRAAQLALSGFANQTHESVASLLSFGFQGMTTDKLLDPRAPIGLRYMSEHIGQLYIREDASGAIETTPQEVPADAPQGAAESGATRRRSARARRARTRPARSSTIPPTYIHRLSPMPRALYDPDRIDYRGKPIASCYLCVDDKQVFDVGGFRTRPLTCSRYEKSPMEDYGRSPAINVLPAVRAAQEIKRDLVTAIEFMAKPALGAHDDLLDQLIMYAPGGISYGALDDRGNR